MLRENDQIKPKQICAAMDSSLISQKAKAELIKTLESDGFKGKALVIFISPESITSSENSKSSEKNYSTIHVYAASQSVANILSFNNEKSTVEKSEEKGSRKYFSVAEQQEIMTEMEKMGIHNTVSKKSLFGSVPYWENSFYLALRDGGRDYNMLPTKNQRIIDIIIAHVCQNEGIRID